MILNEHLYYVGVNDRLKHRFEGLWPLPLGVSYNAYLIDDEQTALVDTVDAGCFEQLLSNIRAVLGDRPLDYLVINHMEPDHSGSIALLRARYPRLRIVGNKKTLEMVGGYYGSAGDAPLTVTDGDVLSLGRHTLRFYLTPMVHWPETMMTYEETTATLFSGDAFGAFGALNGGVVDARIYTPPYFDEMVRYYADIVGKYGVPVQAALKKLSGLDVRMICSTHGPVWTCQAPDVVALYDRLSRYEAEDGVVVAYGSMYGNTARMAEAVAAALSEAGVRRIAMHDLSRSHLSYVLADVFRLRGLILGAPTYNGGLYPPMQALVEALVERGLKNRLTGCFGSFTWAGKAAGRLGEFIVRSGFEAVASPVEMKQGFNASALSACTALGRAMAARLAGGCGVSE